MSEHRPVNFDDFSLAKGGPLYRLLVRMRLMSPDLAPARYRAILLALLTWFPLLLMSVIQGLAYGDALKLPFIYDFTVSVRFLLALPLLIVAECVIDSRSREVIRHFIGSGLVAEKDLPEYETIVRQVGRMVNSALAEGLIVAFVILSTSFLRLEFSGTDSTWQFLVTPSGVTRTAAGWWYLFVSIPVFQFLIYRWLWRYLAWCWFLRRASRLDLRLVPTHPDRAAGLAFLGVLQVKFCVIIVAFSSIISAYFGQEILYGGASLQQYKMMILGYVVMMLIIFLGPFLVFSFKLYAAKELGLLEYGALADDYTQTFDRKWLRGEAPQGEALIGSGDIQSLADLGNSFAVIREMRTVPFDLKMTVIPIAASAILPFLPLVLTVFPLEEIVRKILGILL